MIGPILRRAEAGRRPSHREMAMLLRAEGADYRFLMQTAGRVTLKTVGRQLSWRALVEWEPGLDPESLAQAVAGAQIRSCRCVMIEGPSDVGAEEVAVAVERVKRISRLPLALAFGERAYDEYALWHKAGADQYILPHETSDPLLYADLYPGRSPADRFARYLWLRGLGYQIGGGLVAGGAHRASALVDDLEVLINADMSSVFVRPGEEPEHLHRLVAVLRLCLPRADLWVQADLPGIQAQAALCGVNTVLRILSDIRVSALTGK